MSWLAQGEHGSKQHYGQSCVFVMSLSVTCRLPEPMAMPLSRGPLHIAQSRTMKHRKGSIGNDETQKR